MRGCNLVGRKLLLGGCTTSSADWKTGPFFLLPSIPSIIPDFFPSIFLFPNSQKHGVKGYSSLMFFNGMRIVLPIDYMHNLCLGGVKKMLFLWFDKSHAGKKYSIRGRLHEFDVAMQNIKAPSFISRPPRPYSGHFSHWKGFLPLSPCSFRQQISSPFSQPRNFAVSWSTGDLLSWRICSLKQIMSTFWCCPLDHQSCWATQSPLSIWRLQKRFWYYSFKNLKAFLTCDIARSWSMQFNTMPNVSGNWDPCGLIVASALNLSTTI